MMRTLSAKYTIARSLYSVQRKFGHSRRMALRTAMQAFIPG
ncbi:hypothetical protein UNDKW_1640 [Undibacterium sp. KW1]|nr:hypothetical protein [Undibacterium sp. KW1]BBB59913.1 hypothetical protein UNDKW_1640 [Undibacterium sp. KW1]